MDVHQESRPVVGARWRQSLVARKDGRRDGGVTRVFVAPDLASFRVVARGLLARGEPPERVRFEETRGRRELGREAAGWEAWGRAVSRVPQDFVGLARQVVCHREPARWPLLYRVLWRLTHGEPALLERHDDADVGRLRWLEQAVRRDLQALMAAVRFHRVWRDGREHHVAWYRPEHRIVREVAPFLVRRFPAFTWSLFTPDTWAHWDGARLTFEEGGALPEWARARVARAASHPRPPEAVARAPLLLVGASAGDGGAASFSGPAGALLDVVLGRAGLARSSLQVVRPCGNGCRWRRVGPPPLAWGEAGLCRHGLDAAVAEVRPRMIVALGPVAAQAFLGVGFRMHLSRGQLLDTRWAEGWMATYAPEAVLRLPVGRARAEARIHFEADLRSAAAWLRQRLTAEARARCVAGP
ncbi:DUF4130 domain-containing protein [Corallococcus macrosporus]|uniref:Uracil-DNA glycosylase-like domain-containing protein n=1 Tax=Corallococcus macrosporus DSM 14697 TaxID=1189310 RepID=A0A250JX45_9BACT|nr:DUF4130 domain-containing protein [Corallococcus macrosporus]ATB48293.1 hypothetical protein MYMAC_003919 [Corallococcus macrosporus DSM 14697]